MGGVDSLVVVRGCPNGSSVAEWKLSSSLGGAGESSVLLVPLLMEKFSFKEDCMQKKIVYVKQKINK